MADIEKLVGSESRLELGQKINEIVDGKVSKLGDTMTGGLIISNNHQDALILKNPNIDYNVLPSTAQFIVCQFRDKNDVPMGAVQTGLQSHGAHSIAMVSKKSVSEDIYASLNVGFDGSGVAYAQAPTCPTYTDNSTKIATTAFLKAVLAGNGYGLMSFTKAYNPGGFMLANGIIVNWGAFQPTSDGQALNQNFKYPFSSTNYHVLYSRTTEASTTSAVYYPWTRTKWTAAFQVYAPKISGYSWVAIGY